MADKTLVIERNIDAPLERVWRALTNYEDLKKWLPFFPDFKPEVGFKTDFMLGSDPENRSRHVVEVREVIDRHKLTYTWDYGGMSPDSSVSFELFAEGDATRLVLTCLVASVPADQPDFMGNASAGWNYTADGLKKFAESNN